MYRLDEHVVAHAASSSSMCGDSDRAVRRGCVVGRARQQDRRVRRALGDHDHGVELHAVAHRNHLDALDVVVVGARAVKFAGMSGVMGLMAGADWAGEASAEKTRIETTAAERQKSVIAEFLMGLCKSRQRAGWSQRLDFFCCEVYQERDGGQRTSRVRRYPQNL